ncbi:hypothetical protein THASP1DRAFT_23158 [Thamnocephalis sphaerospora]|uniref:Protein EFR3 n=1 Tax=Thamnocephalis sphaerospora TaxID=78915 RepID=A0A4P9XS58_9FUNG|nr:hypothetical protein THASP1DRAFT_23158 [Thamnocephalis sphaerospora]|eukprot:RKP08947.1 hypothetical protein THASP1DRAFT_23158 [Thamnocephalis sphaerospora]
MLSSRYTKHGTLIRRCYPLVATETKPRSNELSYLTFYATSRPQKLTKVGAFLERRVKSAVWGVRDAENLVSLEILDALVRACQKDLNLFCKHAVTIIQDIILTDRPELVERAATSFVVFSENDTGSALGVDVEFTDIYLSLVEHMSNMALRTDENLATRVIGLKALRGVITSPALRATDAKPYLQRIVPALLYNIVDPTVDTVDRRASTASNRYSMRIENVNQVELNLLSLQCLRDLLRESSALHVKVAVSTAFRCLDERQIWERQDYIVSLLNVIMDATQAQNRFVCLTEILRQLDSADSAALTKKATLSKVLSSLLNQDRTFVGVSVLELLNSLVHHVVISLAHQNTENPDDQNVFIAQELTRCIGGLSNHSYYASQTSDVMNFLINKLRIGSSEEMTDGVSTSVMRTHLLNIMRNVVENSRRGEHTGHFSQRVPIPLEIITPTLPLLGEADRALRFQYIRFMMALMDDGTALIARTPSAPHSRKLTQHVTSMHLTFRFDLLRSLFVYAQRDSVTAGEIIAIFALLQQMLHRFSEGELIRSVPMLMTLLQSFVKDEEKDIKHRATVHTGIVNYFAAADTQLTFPPIREHIRQQNEEAGTWASWWPAEVDMDAIDDITFDDMSESSTIVYLRKDVIVETLCRDPRLQLQYSDLTATLGEDFTQMQPPKNEEHDLFAIRSSRNMEAFKPKLSIRHLRPLEEMTEKTPVIRVENLREALATVQQQPTSEPSEMSLDDSDSHSIVMMTPVKRERLASNKDVDSILKSIGGNPRATRSNISLVHAPV